MNLDWDCDQGPLVPRTTPLPRLKTLHVPTTPRPHLPVVLRSLLQHSPSLEQLYLSHLDKAAEGLEPIIDSLAVQCPQLSSLTFQTGCSGEYLMRIMEIVPEQGLKTFRCRYICDSDSERMMTVFMGHSTSLQRIELTHCSRVASTVIQSVLTTCTGLEVLRVRERNPQGAVSLTFAHAVEHDWVCTNLRKLTLSVWITQNGRNPNIWTKDDYQHWEDLGRFYAQIGALTRLEVLNLKAIGQPDLANPKSFLSPYETCLPGLLALEDPASEGLQIGHLSRLGGLTKLRELRGSF
ncbi:hypothetical protein BGX29_002322, partial [Mortierella sp. GBA35]